MNRFATSLIEKPILLQQERALVGVVSEIVMDPDNGKFIGLLVKEGFGKRKLKAIAEKDIVGIGDNFFLVKGYSVLGEPEEIIRIKKVLDKKVKIIKNRVYTVSGKYLGRVRDYTVDLSVGKLSRLYVTPGLLLGITRELIISYQQIVAIEKDKITVEDTFIKEGKKASAKSEPEVA